MGLNPWFLLNAGDVAEAEALDRQRSGNPRVDRMDARTTDGDQTHVLKSMRYNGYDLIWQGAS